MIVPIYLSYIDKEVYGYWLATGSILVWINIIDPGAGIVLQQKVGYAFGKKNFENLSKLIGTGIIIGTIICGIALAATYSLSFLIPKLIGFESFDQKQLIINAFNLGAIGACFSLIASVLKGINFGMQNTKIPGIIEISSSFSGIVVNVLMLYQGYGLYSIAFMLLINGVLTCLGNLIYLLISTSKKHIQIKYDINDTLHLFREFTYTFFSRLMNTLTSNFDLIVIARFIGPEMVTVVEMTRRPFKIIEGMLYKPSVVLSPAISHLHGENVPEKLHDLLIKYFHYLIWAYCFVISGFILFNKDLVSIWLSKDMFAGNLLSLFIILGISLKGFFAGIGNLNFSLGDIKGSSKTIVFQNLIYVLLVIVLGKLWGINGILLALAPAVLFTSGWYYLWKFYRTEILTHKELNYVVRNISSAIIIAIISYYISNHLNSTSWVQLIISASIYSLLFFAFFYSISTYFRELLIGFLKKIY
ncbi:hypothetical protein NT017_08010 [Prolixibacter sp. NT017]|nr:hypothetical protein NT017_08010 [Prolixibacter sp. NT017]